MRGLNVIHALLLFCKILHFYYKLILFIYFFPSLSDHIVPIVAVHQGTEVVAVDTAETTFGKFPVTLLMVFFH